MKDTFKTLSCAVMLFAVCLTTVMPYNEAIAGPAGVNYRLNRYGTDIMARRGFTNIQQCQPLYTTSGAMVWCRLWAYRGMRYRVHALGDVGVPGQKWIGVFHSQNDQYAFASSNYRKNWPAATFMAQRNGYYWIGAWNNGTKPNGGYIGIQIGY